MAFAQHCTSMSERKTAPEGRVLPYGRGQDQPANEIHWIEIFKDRVAEDLKQVLQEDMDWTTSLPILERLNRLEKMEEARREREEMRKAS